jgi:hypothetical protein
MHINQFLPNLPAAITRAVFANLCATLPQPVTDSPDDLADRDEAAVAAVAALHPADASEAKRAAQIVAADAHAMECLRLAVQPGLDADAVRRWRAQAAGMMRLMQSGLRTLKHDQAAREKAEAEMHPAAMERAGWWFRDASVPEPDEASPSAEAEPDPEADIAAEAEMYATVYPRRAAGIRALGGLPEKLDFGPPSPELVAAIVSGTGPNLRALDAAAIRTNGAAA